MADEQERSQEERARAEGVAEGELIYRSVRQDVEHALSQPTAVLMWSGLAAGLSMGFFPTEVHRAFSHIGHAAMSHDVATTTIRRIFAGYLIAIGYFIPALLGNAAGGVMFVAALAHAQHAPEGSRH